MSALEKIGKIISTLVKRTFCKHDYYWVSDLSWIRREGFSGQALDSFENHEMICKCKKCGKRKKIIFKKSIDK